MLDIGVGKLQTLELLCVAEGAIEKGAILDAQLTVTGNWMPANPSAVCCSTMTSEAPGNLAEKMS